MTLQQYIEHVHQSLISGRAAAARLPDFDLNPQIVKQIAEGLGISFVPEKEQEGNVCLANNEEVRPEYRTTFAPIDLLDYIYAVLHSPAYRERYKEFLEIDFPRVPYPKDAVVFWKLVELGGQIRQAHLLENPTTSRYITQYPVDGDNEVVKPRFLANVIVRRNDEAISQSGTEGNVEAISPSRPGRVYINDTQYFDGVPELAWNIYIGGYRPAQKWLKDRKGRKLEFEDILHYQKIIVALAETDRLMKEIEALCLGFTQSPPR
jgi:hypothetical protein